MLSTPRPVAWRTESIGEYSTTPLVVREVLDNGLRLITETMPQVRSVTIGVWLTRGSRHEADDAGGIAHFVEHMLFKGTDTRSAEDIAQAIDSIGGQLDAFTAKEYASYYIKVLDEHLPLAVDLLSDIVLRPAFAAEEIEREKKVILEEIKMVEDTPDDLVHELFTQHFWEGHPLGRPILGSKETVESLTAGRCSEYFRGAYVGAEHDHLGGRQHRARPAARPGRAGVRGAAASGDAVRRSTRRRSCRRSSPGPRSSNRAMSASAPPAIRRATTIATSATS